ncbi:MAG: hypothetical protein C6Y22_03625 [Hapalosiphonaceae cyanobacterium JJU2]|nr:MAG: hypothetical protein C6Y22_03625 [Hapalosiphonaceae cyanobacterium JJU2]
MFLPEYVLTEQLGQSGAIVENLILDHKRITINISFEKLIYKSFTAKTIKTKIVLIETLQTENFVFM